MEYWMSRVVTLLHCSIAHGSGMTHAFSFSPIRITNCRRQLSILRGTRMRSGIWAMFARRAFWMSCAPLDPRVTVVRGNCDSNFDWPLIVDLVRGRIERFGWCTFRRTRPPGMLMLFCMVIRTCREMKNAAAFCFLNPGCVTRPNRGAARAWRGSRLRWENKLAASPLRRRPSVVPQRPSGARDSVPMHWALARLGRSRCVASSPLQISLLLLDFRPNHRRFFASVLRPVAGSGVSFGR